MAYRHEGFWQPMDTLRERKLLEDLWASGQRALEVLAVNDGLEQTQRLRHRRHRHRRLVARQAARSSMAPTSWRSCATGTRRAN